MRKKVAVIGAGNVGSSTAYYIAKQGLADVVLIDVVPGLPQSRAQDFTHVDRLQDFHVAVSGSNDYSAIKDADVIVHTAGIARKPGMDRMDLLRINVNIARDASKAIKTYAPNAIVLAVANPLDVIALTCLRETGFPPHRVFGMAGILDATRFRYFIAEALQVIPENIFAMVLGGHGDTMVPLPRYTTVSGIPLTSLTDEKTIEAMVQRTRTGGAEIVNHLKTGSAYYAPAASVAKMVHAILSDTKTISPTSAYLNGEYNQKDLYLGVPVLLGAGGIEEIYELDLAPEEQAALNKSADAVREGIALLDSL